MQSWYIMNVRDPYTAIFVYWRRTKINICLLEQNGVKTYKRTICAHSEQIFWPDFGSLSWPFAPFVTLGESIQSTYYIQHCMLKHMCFCYPRTKQQTHDKGSMVRTQYCSGRMDWLRLWYGTLVRFLCSEMIDEGTTSIVYGYLRIWPYTHFGLTREATHYAALVWDTIFPSMVKLYSVRQQQ